MIEITDDIREHVQNKIETFVFSLTRSPNAQAKLAAPLIDDLLAMIRDENFDGKAEERAENKRKEILAELLAEQARGQRELEGPPDDDQATPYRKD